MRNPEMNFMLISEVIRSVPNDAAQKNKFKIFIMGVDFITNFRGDLKINFNFIYEDSRS